MTVYLNERVGVLGHRDDALEGHRRRTLVLLLLPELLRVVRARHLLAVQGDARAGGDEGIKGGVKVVLGGRFQDRLQTLLGPAGESEDDGTVRHVVVVSLWVLRVFVNLVGYVGGGFIG